MEAVFLKILNMSCCAADVIGVVLLVWLALWRAPKKWRYLLWIVVAFRLVCPVSFSAPFSVMRYAVQPAAVTQRAERSVSEITYIPQNIGEMAEPKVYVSSSPAVSEYVSQSLPRPLPWNSANPLQIYIPICAGLWCLGMAALLLYGIISYVNLRRRLRGAIRTENGVFETDSVRAPFILGLFSPTIYLPPGLEGEPLRYVLAHERFHIRHADHAVKLFGFLLLCVHWFNPLVWLAFALMSRDMEMRCDEAVLSAGSGITKPYSMALLSFASARRFPSPSPLCFGETGVGARIKNVLRWKKPKVWVTVCAAALCVIAVAACAANPNKGESKSEPTGTPWDWTSTVQLSDVKVIEESRGITLSHSQMKELIRLLNAVQEREVVRGRGIPSNLTLDITSGVGYKLRWAGGIIELDFDDAAAAAELYGGADAGPGVWEIHNQALYDFLDGLKEEAPAASATDLESTEPTTLPEPLHSYEAISGGESVQLVPLLTAEEGQEYEYLTITYGESGPPFFIRRDGETIICGYAVYDAETQEPLDFVHPSGLSPQHYIFQNAVPGRKYIVVVDTFTDDPVYGRTYAFGAIVPKRDGVGLQKPMPSILGDDGTELHLNMNLQDLDAALDTQLAQGAVYQLPQHRLAVAAICIKDPAAWMFPVVQLGFSEGWTLSEGPGIGATTQEVRAYWGEPYVAAEPANERTPTVNYLLYELADGFLEFDHRGDGVISQISLFSKSDVNGKAGKLGTRTYYHGRSGAHIENFNCFGEVFLMCISWEHGPYRMVVTDADGTETVLAEGTGSYQTVVPAPLVQNGTLDVEVSSNWILEINWLPTEENRIQRETVSYP